MANLVPGAGYGVVISIGKERSRSYAMRPTEAFSRVEIDRLLKDAAWNLTDGHSVRYEYCLSGGTRADYVLATGTAGPWRSSRPSARP